MTIEAKVTPADAITRTSGALRAAVAMAAGSAITKDIPKPRAKAGMSATVSVGLTTRTPEVIRRKAADGATSPGRGRTKANRGPGGMKANGARVVMAVGSAIRKAIRRPRVAAGTTAVSRFKQQETHMSLFGKNIAHLDELFADELKNIYY